MKFQWRCRREEAPAGLGERSVWRVQFGCLLAVAFLDLFFFAVEARGNGIAWLYLERYLTIPAMLFLGASLTRRIDDRSRGIFLLSMLMLGWFLIAQTAHRLQNMDAKEIGAFVCTYGMILPFAALSGDAQRQRGLKCMAAAAVAVGALLTIYAVLLVLNLVPAFLQDYVYWDGNRFLAVSHPNLCATLLMISMALCMGFFFRVHRTWGKVLLLALNAVQFGALALTNGRTTAVFTCALMGGIVFCALRGKDWKRAVAALLAAVLVMGALFAVSQKIVDVNKTHLKTAASQTQTSAQEEEKPRVVNGQKSWDKDIRTLNGRTKIWESASNGLRDNPSIRCFGTEYTGLIISQYNPFPVYHAHNSWLQILYETGIPGLVLALLITVLALWGAAVQLWRNTDLWKSCIALLVLCLLGCAVLEPYLFTADPGDHFFDMLFMLCTGYLHMWCREPQ